MPAPDRTYRLADCGIYLRQVMRLSHTAQAVYLYLREGPRSQRSYVVEINAHEIAGRLQTSVPASRRAIAELVAAGLLELDETGELGWLCADAARFPPANQSVSTSILGDLSAYSATVLMTKVREFIRSKRDTVRDTVADTVRDTQGVRESGIQGSRNQGKQEHITPTASAHAAAVPLQLESPKVNATNPDKLPAAVLHRQLAHAAAEQWSSIIGVNTARCVTDRTWDAQNARNVANIVASLGGVRQFMNLCEWADARSDYYAGRTYPDRSNNELRKAWTLTAWATRSNIEAMYAKCRQDALELRGREPTFTFDPTRKPEPEMLNLTTQEDA